MKKLLLILAVLSMPAQADCSLLSKVAEEVMNQRQKVGDIVEITERCQGMEELKDLCVSLVPIAYKRKRWHTESMIDRSISDFKTDFYMFCLENRRKKEAENQ